MLLHKSAGFGQLARNPGAPGVGQRVSRGFADMTRTMQTISAAGQAKPPVPSDFALRIIWSLNAVRDALCDQVEPSLEATNTMLANRSGSEAVEALREQLQKDYQALVGDYDKQFAPLDADTQEFFLQRRERLAQLAAFEWAVMATVGDKASPRPDKVAEPAKSKAQQQRQAK